MSKEWYDVTVTESYHATYKVLAEDQQEANDMIDNLINVGQIDPTNDEPGSYDRDVSVNLGDEPNKGDEYWTNNDGEEECELFRGTKKGKRKFRLTDPVKKRKRR